MAMQDTDMIWVFMGYVQNKGTDWTEGKTELTEKGHDLSLLGLQWKLQFRFLNCFKTKDNLKRRSPRKLGGSILLLFSCFFWSLLYFIGGFQY